METRANKFDEWVGKLQMEKAIELSVGNSVLEFGCGKGQFTPLLYKKFKRVVGIDLSKKNIALAKKTTTNAQHSFLVGNAENFQIDGKFDTVMAIMLLEHVNDPVAVLKNAKKHLKDSGRIIIQAPNANSFNRQLAKYMGLIDDLHQLPQEQIKKYGHKRVYDITLLTEDIKRAGLLPLIKTGVVFKPFTNTQMQLLCKRYSKEWQECFVRALAKMGKRFPLECTILCIVAVKP